MLTNYYPMTYSYYQGSIEDNPYTAKWGMVTKFLDLNDETLTPFEGMTFGIIGFKSDKGVYINNGRVGAVEGPTAIRSQSLKLPWHWGTNVTVYDVGNIDGPNHSLEELQESLSQAIQRMYQLGIQPIVLGGGHGTAYGHYLGIQSSLEKDEQLAVINLDAHFDLRPYDQTGPTLEQVFVKWLIMLKKKVRTSLTSSWGSKSTIITSSSLITLLKHQALIF